MKEEVLITIAGEGMERQEQLMNMAKDYGGRFQQTFERLERLAEGTESMGRQLEETRDAMSMGDVGRKTTKWRNSCRT